MKLRHGIFTSVTLNPVKQLSYLFFLWWIKHAAFTRFYLGHSVEESKWAQRVFYLFIYLTGSAASQLSNTAVYVRKVTTIPYSFQFKGYSMVWLPTGPPTTACTCLLPKRALLQSQPWEAKHGRSKGRRWRVNVCWHLGSLPLRQSGVWI